MPLRCPNDDCDASMNNYKTVSTHFASTYYYECPDCGEETATEKWS